MMVPYSTAWFKTLSFRVETRLEQGLEESPSMADPSRLENRRHGNRIIRKNLTFVHFFYFQDEFHTRLRFIRRGLVAMANAGPHDNGSQFFFTLGRADELNNKHTIFGKVNKTRQEFCSEFCAVCMNAVFVCHSERRSPATLFITCSD